MTIYETRCHSMILHVSQFLFRLLSRYNFHQLQIIHNIIVKYASRGKFILYSEVF